MKDSSPPVIVIIGPTASGKSDLALALAAEFNGEIISADSMQVYKGMDIGTAKPLPGQLKKVKHHLIDILEPEEEFSLSQFIDMSQRAISDIRKRGKLPIMVGGTGLYLKALFEGFSLPDAKKDESLRERLYKIAETETGRLELYEKLKKVDPKAALKIHQNDSRRIVRALEVFETMGRPISFVSGARKPADENFMIIGLELERGKLYKKIEERVDEMLSKGLVEEVKKLLARGTDEKTTAFQALGYKEILGFLKGKYPLKEAIGLIKKRTRNFAKRQMTWFRYFKDVEWFDAESKDLIESVSHYLKSNVHRAGY